MPISLSISAAGASSFGLSQSRECLFLWLSRSLECLFLCLYRSRVFTFLSISVARVSISLSNLVARVSISLSILVARVSMSLSTLLFSLFIRTYYLGMVVYENIRLTFTQKSKDTIVNCVYLSLSFLRLSRKDDVLVENKNCFSVVWYGSVIWSECETMSRRGGV